MKRPLIGVVGAGAWGTALATVAARAGNDVLIQAREGEVVDSINTAHENTLFLPTAPLDPAIRATTDLAELADCALLLIVTPAQHVRATLAALPDTHAPLVLCAKGIEANTQMLVSEVAKDVRADARLAVLSGPTFAHEVAHGLPAAVTLACEDEAHEGEGLWEAISPLLSSARFRPYYSDDIVGAEIGGAVKNVLAVASGVVDGANLGLNARAAVIARGFAEMQRFGLARGGRAETLAGLSGLGDLVLTCSSENSRNFSLGRGLGQGASAAALLSDRRTVAEGAFTAPVLQAAALAMGVEMPIVDAVCALLSGEQGVAEVVERLMARPLKTEGQ